MKQTRIITVIIIICSAFFFAACKNDISKPSEIQNDQQLITITGIVDIDSAAIPSQLLSGSSERSASFDISELNLNFDLDNTTITAVQLSTGYEVSGQLFYEEGAYRYKYVLPTTGRWCLKIQTTNGSQTFYGERVADIEKHYTSPISLTPVFKDGEKGNIFLVVKTKVPQEDISSNYKVEFIWKTNKPSGFNTIEQSLSYKENSVAFFNIENVPAGAYEVQFKFRDKYNNVIYSSYQWIHVFGGLTTDTWYGTGPQYLADVEGKKYLTLTEGLIREYHNMTGYEYKPVNTILYRAEGADKYSYEYIENYSYPKNQFNQIPLLERLPDSASVKMITDIFCYANDEVIYVVGKTQDDSQNYIIKITPDNNQTEASPIENTQIDLGAIYYNNKNDKFYALTKGQTPGSNAKVSFPQLLELNYDSITNQYRISHTYPPIMLNQKVSDFVIMDNRLFIADYDSLNKTVNLRWWQFDESNDSIEELTAFTILNVCDKSTLNIPENEEHSIIINDILYLHDCFYILFGDYYFGRSNLYSRGGIISYNYKTKSTQVGGLMMEGQFNSKNTIQHYYCSTSPTEINEVYSTPSQGDIGKRYYKNLDTNPTWFNTVNREGEFFYCPQKFIAYDGFLMWITDSGYKVNFQYIYDNNYITKLTPVNRAVVVRCENLQFDETTSLVNTLDETNNPIPFTSAKDNFTFDVAEPITKGDKVYTADDQQYDGAIYPFIAVE